jgi:hypothetical protein
MLNEILRNNLVDDREIARPEPFEQQAFESIRVRSGHRASLYRGTERRRPLRLGIDRRPGRASAGLSFVRTFALS